MQIQKLADYTAQILLDYYENRIQPFLDACDEDVLWIGPAVGQVIRTKEALVAAFAAEKHELRFAVHNLTATLLPTGSSWFLPEKPALTGSASAAHKRR